MIEHGPSIGRYYEQGIRGEKIAIVGYSHYRKPEHFDHEDFTQSTINHVLTGKQSGDSFFPAIPQYFGYVDKASLVTFWNSVLFFNFIPECIGTSAEKHRNGTLEQIRSGRTRFIRILSERQPSRVFVFTRKGWASMPRNRRGKGWARLRIFWESVIANFHGERFRWEPIRWLGLGYATQEAPIWC